MRGSRFIRVSVDNHMIQLLNSLYKCFFQLIQLCHILVELPIHKLYRLGKSCNSRNIFRAGTDSVLLSASKQNRFQLYLLIHIQKAGSLRAMDLVSADRQHIDLQLFRKNPVFSIPLDCIHMKQDPGIFPLDQRPCLCNGLHGSHFIVCMHNGYQYSFACDRPFQILQADTALFINRKIRHPKTFLLQVLHSLQDCRMLNLCCDQMSAASAICICASHKRQIVGLRPA